MKEWINGERYHQFVLTVWLNWWLWRESQWAEGCDKSMFLPGANLAEGCHPRM